MNCGRYCSRTRYRTRYGMQQCDCGLAAQTLSKWTSFSQHWWQHWCEELSQHFWRHSRASTYSARSGSCVVASISWAPFWCSGNIPALVCRDLSPITPVECAETSQSICGWSLHSVIAESVLAVQKLISELFNASCDEEYNTTVGDLKLVQGARTSWLCLHF
jgi:hypothetical protein